MNGARCFFVIVAVLSAGAACSDDPTTGGTGAGTVSLRLSTPHADDGALLFEVSGPPIDTAMAANASLQLFTRRTGDGALVGVVAGEITNGAVVTLQVPDAGAAAEYTARVIEVADRQNVLRASLTGYALTSVR